MAPTLPLNRDEHYTTRSLFIPREYHPSICVVEDQTSNFHKTLLRSLGWTNRILPLSSVWYIKSLGVFDFTTLQSMICCDQIFSSAHSINTSKEQIIDQIKKQLNNRWRAINNWSRWEQLETTWATCVLFSQLSQHCRLLFTDVVNGAIFFCV